VYPPKDLPPVLEMLGLKLGRAVAEGLSAGVEAQLRSDLELAVPSAR
jgi:hypothetical protein